MVLVTAVDRVGVASNRLLFIELVLTRAAVRAAVLNHQSPPRPSRTHETGSLTACQE